MSHPPSPAPRRWLRGGVVLFALGATLGTLLDAIHTQSGATAYTYPVIAETAWWVPLLFGWAFTNGLVRPFLDRGPAPPAKTVVIAMSLFALAYVCSIAPLPWPLTSALLFAIFVVAYLLCDRTRVGLIVALTSAVMGPLFEVVLVRAGQFAHTKPAFLGVSGWLPFLYLTAAVALQCLAKYWVDGPRAR